MSRPPRRLADILVEHGLVTPAQLERAHDEALGTSRPLGRVLVGQGAVTEAQLVAALAAQVDLDFVDLTEATPDTALTLRVGLEVCRRHTVVPVRVEDDLLVLAMADPGDVFALDHVRSRTGLDVRPVVATRDDVRAAVRQVAADGPGVDDIAEILGWFGSGNPGPSAGPVPATVGGPTDDAAAGEGLVSVLVEQAVRDRAEEVLVEPQAADVRVRHRVDGVLHDVARCSLAAGATVVRYLASLTGLAETPSDLPRRAVARVRVPEGHLELLVRVLPAPGGQRLQLVMPDPGPSQPPPPLRVPVASVAVADR